MRRHATIPFDFHREVALRQNAFPQLENARKLAGGEAVIPVVLACPKLENTGFPLPDRADAVDEMTGDVPDLGQMKMRRDRVAARKQKIGPRFRMPGQNGTQFRKFHVTRICLNGYIHKP